MEAIYAQMVRLRRAFHRHPELAFEEAHTAGLIMEELKRLAIPCTYQGKGSAVVARIAAANAGAVTIALRADMDALPGNENTNLPFASTTLGKMHACGHDAHMAILLGAAALLKASPPAVDVLLVFQPAEEKGGGSRVVINSGLLKDVTAIFGGHVTHHYKIGEIMVEPGVITAHSDRFRIRIKGRGGHGARPHEATDAVVVSGLLIVAIQTLVSREIDPVHPSVVTIGTVRAGSAPNVIAEEAELEGSIRTTLPQVRDHIHRGLRRMATAVANLHNADVEVEIHAGYPPVINSERETMIARRAACRIVGEQGVMKMDYPSMGSEDFSYYLQEIPGCYVRFGARSQEQIYVPLHSSEFDIDERVLKVGAAYFAALAEEAEREYR